MRGDLEAWNKTGGMQLEHWEGNQPEAFPVGSLSPEIALESGARVWSVCAMGYPGNILFKEC